MKGKIKIWVLIALAGLLAVFLLYRAKLKAPEVHLGRVTRGEVIDAVYATGEVRAFRRAGGFG